MASPSPSRHVALLRGINVGGRNPVPMAELERRVSACVAERFGLSLVVVVRSCDQVRRVVAEAPGGFGTRPDTFHSDVVYLKSPLTSSEAMAVVKCRDGVDEAWPGDGVVYFQRLSARRAQSHMSKIIGTPPYQQMTIRNWATTTKLLTLLDAG